MRKTKIICTIGPVSESEEKLKELLLAGMNVARFNFSHGDHAGHQIKLERARRAARELGLPLATMQDTKGPEIRLKDFEGGKVCLETGATSITYKNLKNDVEIGKSILIDDGLVELTIKAIEDTDIVCEVINGGYISNHKGINVPGAILSMGIDNLDEILAVSDGIMVARGDMGVEIPLEEVPVLQKKMIKKALQLGKIVITATQMLDSMIKNPRPTRAETTDVANAIYDGTSAIMLSGESAAGAYPIEAVKTMSRIAERTEEDICYAARLRERSHNWENNEEVTTAICHACCTTAMDLNAKAIITVTMSGFTAGMISKYQPGCTVIGCAVDEMVYRQMALMFGVSPLLIAKEDDAEELFNTAVKASVDAGLIGPGDKVVITAGVPLGVAGNTNMVRVVEV